MAPPRKAKGAKGRTRNYAAEYERRQQRAREKGFADYYEQRTRERPGAPKPSPEQLRRRRGHAGRSDLLRQAKAGDLVSVVATDRDAKGRLTRIHVSRIDQDGKETDYWINTKRMRQKDIDEMIDKLLAKGIVDSPSYPLQQFRSGSSARRASAG